MQRGELEVVKTKNGLLPKMDLFISLGKTGYASSFGGSVRDVGGRSFDISAGIEFEFPIANRGTESRHRRSVLTRKQAEEALENLFQLAELDVRSAYIEVQQDSYLHAMLRYGSVAISDNTRVREYSTLGTLLQVIRKLG